MRLLEQDKTVRQPHQACDPLWASVSPAVPGGDQLLPTALWRVEGEVEPSARPHSAKAGECARPGAGPGWPRPTGPGAVPGRVVGPLQSLAVRRPPLYRQPASPMSVLRACASPPRREQGQPQLRAHSSRRATPPMSRAAATYLRAALAWRPEIQDPGALGPFWRLRGQSAPGFSHSW